MTDPAAESGRSGPERPGSSAPGEDAPESATFGESWEQLAAGLMGELQGWLIRVSARGMRDELRDQARRAFGGSRQRTPEDVWATATSEPPEAASEPPECAWCPICRAARRISRATAESGAWVADGSPSGGGRSGGGRSGGEDGVGAPEESGGSGGARGGAADPDLAAWLREASGMVSAAATQVLEGLDAVLSFRPADADASHPEPGEPPAGPDHSEERADESDDRS